MALTEMPIGTPVLYRAVEIPRAFRQCHDMALGDRSVSFDYGGDLRLGDLTGNATPDLLLYRCHAGSIPCFLGAFDLRGTPLWNLGAAGEQPLRPGPVAVYDLDSDSCAEVICCFADPEDDPEEAALRVLVLNGRSGGILREARLALPGGTARAYADHMRIQVARFRARPRPEDLLLSTGHMLVALDRDLRELWRYTIPPEWLAYGQRPAYVPALGDLDGDGCDETNGGYFLLDQDGRVLWEKLLAPHTDSVAIAEWEPGIMRAFASGHGHVLDATGHPVLRLGPDLVPHGQELRVARFFADRAGQQMLIRCQGHAPTALAVDSCGEILSRFELNATTNHTGMDAVYWNGPDAPALLANGDHLWTGAGEMAWTLPGLPMLPGNPEALRMSWYHCIPADVCGDTREEVVLYNPWGACVYIFTPFPCEEAAYRGYRPGPRQYNVRLMN